MSEETVGALFEYPYNQYLMTRLEFVLITNDELEAKIMRIIEVEMLKVKAIWQRAVLEAIEKKQEPPPEPEEYWVTMSRGLFIAFLYKFDTATVGAKHPNSISKSSLRRAIDDLIDVKQFLFSRAQPGNEFGATQYTLNREVIQERMRNLPKHPMSLFLKGYSNLETGGVSNLETPTSQKGNSSVSNLATPQFPNLRTLSNSNLDNNNLDIDTYSENVASANSHTPTPLSLQDQLEAARQLLLAHGQYPQSAEQQPSSELSTPVVETSSESVENVEPTRQDDVQTEEASEQSYSRTTTQNVPAEVEDTTRSEQKPARAPRTRKPKAKIDLDRIEPLPPPARPDESIAWSARKILLWGDFFRGYALEPSENGNSTYMKNEKAAIQLFQRGNITEKKFVSVFRYMRGKKIVEDRLEDDLAFRDKWWVENVSADVFHVGKHFDDIVAKIKSNGGKDSKIPSTVQQQLESAAEGFTIKSQSELMKMQPEKRKEYGRELNAFLAMKKETEKQQAQTEQASSQKAG